MKPAFTSTQEMYNYAANQLMNQSLSPETVRLNLMEHEGVTFADAETVVDNMLIEIERRKKAGDNSNASTAASTVTTTTAPTPQTYGSFATMQEMYNYAAKQLITEKQSQETTKRNLLNHGITEEQANEVIKNMMEQILKNKPKEVNTKKEEGRKMMIVGLVIAVIGGILYGAKFDIAGQAFAVSYGIMIIGGLLFFRGLFRMF